MPKHFTQWEWSFVFPAATGTCVWDYFKSSTKFDVVSFLNEQYLNLILIYFKRNDSSLFFTHPLIYSFWKLCLFHIRNINLAVTPFSITINNIAVPNTAPLCSTKSALPSLWCQTEALGIHVPLPPPCLNSWCLLIVVQATRNQMKVWQVALVWAPCCSILLIITQEH